MRGPGARRPDPSTPDAPFFDHEANYSGHEPKTAGALHDPQYVVDAVIRFVEARLAKRTHKPQIVDAPAAERTVVSAGRRFSK